MLKAYDTDGKVVATLDLVVARDEHGVVIGLVDLEAYAAAGGRLRDIWDVAGAVRSEWVAPESAEQPTRSGTPPHLPIMGRTR